MSFSRRKRGQPRSKEEIILNCWLLKIFSRNIDLLLFVVLVAFSVRVLACLLAWPNLDGREQNFASNYREVRVPTPDSEHRF